MKIVKRSSTSGTLVALAATSLLASATFAVAQTALSVNGVDIDSTIITMYVESRIQKPVAQATPDELESVTRELVDIYLLTTNEKAEALAEDPRVKAQIELQGRAVMAQLVASEYLGNNPASDEEILAEYQVQVTNAPAQQFKARHILVETQSAAAELISQLDEGADFAELAQTHSTGPTGANGGDLGWFSPEQMVKPFTDAVAALEDGAHTAEPVQTQFGWHVIMREESRENTPPTLESVRDVIKQRIEQMKFAAYLETLRADYENQN